MTNWGNIYFINQNQNFNNKKGKKIIKILSKKEVFQRKVG
jgi:hypothetical protein